ncbi:hypothetical protein GCM10011348_10330 [Marinobacterium nitratireducens]|uniref:Peptidase C39-like domain-containing protein n=1 Tax=Marinobacterium nitratireducens TaxID=518897 RepID=A0A917ZBL3_9GAMM|nr:PA2778 family cysteine peptidase [Marinobacterium nitratireducens]GGO78431.1 hypothetical protein GCM10011348_10330 [Marinobacterium nitratireducens]
MQLFRTAARSAAVLLCLLWLGGCASRLPVSEIDRLADSLPVFAELKDVPFYPQELYQCGPAALATVLVHRDRSVTPDSLVPQLFIPERHGSLQIEMKVATRRQGLPAFAGPDSLDGLLAEIAAGRPVIVLQNLGLELLPQWHYAVAVGYDLAEQMLILRSGTEKRLLTPLGLFERTWERSGRWSLLALPPNELPLQIEPATAVRDALDLEQTHPDAARQTLLAASRRWPDDYLAQMAAGNAELAAGQPTGAGAAYQRALKIRPDAAEAWNNLAYSLDARGCDRPARQAIDCALTLAPDNPAIVQSHRELSDGQPVSSTQCQAIPLCPTAP